jgi:large subunit ribosomal protein L15
MPLTLDDLRGGPGSHRDKKRVGRGHGSGKGKTAGRGTKGQKARSGRGVGRGFEGGQLPIQQRLPYKRGFTNIYKTRWEVVNLGRLETLEVEGPITPEVLYARGVTRGMEFPVKILAKGELSRPLVIHAHAFSGAAREAIEARGGTVQELERTDRWVTARPQSRRLPINRELKRARLGKVGGIKNRDELNAGEPSEES